MSLFPPRILLLDDDEHFLELYREMLSKHLSCLPEVRIASSSSRALALLESEPFTLLIVDLHLPKMDGLQVLAVVRRKWPHLRLVVLTAIRDEQFRTRAYALGADQYWIKPESDQEVGLFMESVESLLSNESQGGFRGVQSKSLVDIIQLECLSQNSGVLKITNGLVEGRIWLDKGEIIHAEAAGVTGEPAFQKILSWKTGSFEILPPDTTQQRTILSSYQGLLLNTAQALDEAASQVITPEPASPGSHAAPAPVANTATLLAELSELDQVEFVLALDNQAEQFWGLENAKPVVQWMRQTLKDFRGLGENLQAGELQQISGSGSQRQVVLTSCGTTQLCVGFPPGIGPDKVRETMKTVLTKWAS